MRQFQNIKTYIFIALLIGVLGPREVFALSSEIPADISAGGRHVLALKKNGEVWAWGDNSEGQLGSLSIGAKSFQPIKVSLPAERRAISVSGGDRHSLILLDDHTVIGLGVGLEGGLRLGGNGGKYSFIPGLTDVTAIAAGGLHSLVLKKDGTVWAFGSNICGQLGDGTQTDRATLVEVVGLKNKHIVAIAAGLQSSYALTKDGCVFTWGMDVTARADENKTNRREPVQVEGLTGIKAIAAGWRHAVALKSDGTVWFWGKRWNGIFGIKDTEDFVSQPQEVAGIGDAVKIAAGSEHTVVVRADGAMWAFGSNTKGQLGTEEAWPGSVIFTPQPSVLKNNVEKVTAGIDTTYALRKDGNISAFGSFESGQMGDGIGSHATAVQVYEETKADNVTCGISHTAIRRVDGTVGWVGFYDTEKFAREEKNPNDQSYKLKILMTLGTIIQVASGNHHSILLRSDGTVWAYGKGEKGQLGDGKNETSMIPVQVTGLTNILAIAAGGESSLAICSDGSVMTWGSNEFGQLGDGTTDDRPRPVTVSGLPQIIATAPGEGQESMSKEERTICAMGKDHALVRAADGTLWIWGNNKDRQLIGSADTIIKTPQKVPNLTDVKSVAAGEGFSLALLKNQTVFAWGKNFVGQLGLGNEVATPTPTSIPGLTSVAQIAAGTWHSLARLKDGTVKAWGLNDLGQLGNGTFNNRNSPVTVQGLERITDIAAGERHSLAVRNDHTIWSWGSNEYEQLGVSATREHRSAIRLIADSADVDADGMLDSAETIYFGDLAHTGTIDSDGDGWTDIQEVSFGTNPTLADTDRDNLRDIADSLPHPASVRNHLEGDRSTRQNHRSEKNQNNPSAPSLNHTVKGLIILPAESASPQKTAVSTGVDRALGAFTKAEQIKITFPRQGSVL
ncbi:MAG: RCC1 repeat-containing protein [Verrucomicrobia bacterium]|nr:MAG: RCC1 repeat-containing protein [Verrucomicrobiota bacterium]